MIPCPYICLFDEPSQRRLFEALYARGWTFAKKPTFGQGWAYWLRCVGFSGTRCSHPYIMVRNDKSLTAYMRKEHFDSPSFMLMNSVPHFLRYLDRHKDNLGPSPL